jgi:hypothetical protein
MDFFGIFLALWYNEKNLAACRQVREHIFSDAKEKTAFDHSDWGQQREHGHQHDRQGSILQNSISAGNFSDEFPSTNFGTNFDPKPVYKKLHILVCIMDNNFGF